MHPNHPRLVGQVELVLTYTAKDAHGVTLRASSLLQELGFKVLEAHGRSIGGAAMLMFHVLGPSDSREELEQRMDQLVKEPGELPASTLYARPDLNATEYRLEIRAVYNLDLLAKIVHRVGRSGGSLFHHSVSLEQVRGVEIACHRFGIRLPTASIGQLPPAVVLEATLREEALTLGLGRLDLKPIVSALE